MVRIHAISYLKTYQIKPELQHIDLKDHYERSFIWKLLTLFGHAQIDFSFGNTAKTAMPSTKGNYYVKTTNYIFHCKALLCEYRG